MLVVEILQDKAARSEGEHCARIFVPFLLEPEAEMLIEALACAEVLRGQTPRMSKVLEPPRPPLVLRHFLQNHHCLCLAKNGELGRAVWPLWLGLFGRSLPRDRDDGNEMPLDATDATLETAAVRQSGFFGGNQRRLE
jgi:hypothetical protein